MVSEHGKHRQSVTDTIRLKDFKSATSGVHTKTMRNELNKLVGTVQDPKTQRVSPRPLRRPTTDLSFCRLST